MKLFAHPNKNRMRSNKKVIDNSNKPYTPWALDLALIFNWTDIIDEEMREEKKVSEHIPRRGKHRVAARGALLRKSSNVDSFLSVRE